MIEMLDEPQRGYADVLAETRRYLGEVIRHGGSGCNAKVLAEELQAVTPGFDWTHLDVEKFVDNKNARFLSDRFSAHADNPGQLKLDNILAIHAFATDKLQHILLKLREAGTPKLDLEVQVLASKTRMTFTLMTPFARELAANPEFRRAAQDAMRALVRGFTAGMREGVAQRIDARKLDR